MSFDETYPNKPPKVRFISKMFHPNGKNFENLFFTVYADGQLCLDILQNKWSPSYDVAAILISIQVKFFVNAFKSLLDDPESSSPANPQAASLYLENRKDYNRRVQEIVEQSWVEE